jgi:hypothetical protein
MSSLQRFASAAALLLVPLLAGPARSAPAEPRTALVIGNAAYEFAPLRNPGNDARAMSEALRSVGFEVTERMDLDQKGMKLAIRDFGLRLKERGGIGLFYFAGHGMQVQGENYLLPIGARIELESDVDIEGVRAAQVMARMEAAGNDLNIVILDACRNNPFARSFRSYYRGLAVMDAPTGTLVAYATAPGNVAEDGDGDNGLYTGELVEAIGQPGIRLVDVFQQTRLRVQAKTQGRQVPWESVSLTRPFYFSPPVAESEPPVPVGCPPGTGWDGSMCVAVRCPAGSIWRNGECVVDRVAALPSPRVEPAASPKPAPKAAPKPAPKVAPKPVASGSAPGASPPKAKTAAAASKRPPPAPVTAPEPKSAPPPKPRPAPERAAPKPAPVEVAAAAIPSQRSVKAPAAPPCSPGFDTFTGVVDDIGWTKAIVQTPSGDEASFVKESGTQVTGRRTSWKSLEEGDVVQICWRSYDRGRPIGAFRGKDRKARLVYVIEGGD